MSTFEEFQRFHRKAEGLADSLRGRSDLPALAQARGQRYMVCHDRLRRVGEGMSKEPVPASAALFQEAKTAASDFDAAHLDHLAAVIALGGDGMKDELDRLSASVATAKRAGIQRL